MGRQAEAFATFRDQADWLTDDDAPAVAMLEALAELLDGENATPALYGQFGLAYRNLLKRKPVADQSDDPVGEELEAALGDDD